MLRCWLKVSQVQTTFFILYSATKIIIIDLYFGVFEVFRINVEERMRTVNGTESLQYIVS